MEYLPHIFGDKNVLTKEEVLEILSNMDIDDSGFGDSSFVLSFPMVFLNKESIEELIAFIQ